MQNKLLATDYYNNKLRYTSSREKTYQIHRKNLCDVRVILSSVGIV